MSASNAIRAASFSELPTRSKYRRARSVPRPGRAARTALATSPAHRLPMPATPSLGSAASGNLEARQLGRRVARVLQRGAHLLQHVVGQLVQAALEVVAPGAPDGGGGARQRDRPQDGPG